MVKETIKAKESRDKRDSFYNDNKDPFQKFPFSEQIIREFLRIRGTY